MPDVQQELAEIKAEVANLKVDITRVEAEVRVTKHDVASLRQDQVAIVNRIDKLEERIVGKIELLTEKLTGVNLKQERGLGFFAGVSAVITIAGGFLLAIGKILFGA